MGRWKFSAIAHGDLAVQIRLWTQRIVLIAFLLTSCGHWCCANANDKVTSTGSDSVGKKSKILTFRSEHFRIHSDLSKDKAHALLLRMESTLRRVSKYWRRPPHSIIEAFIVNNLSDWSSEDLPHTITRLMLEHIGGVTVPVIHGGHNPAKNQAIIYATTRPSIAEHEVVHAYCCQTFGSCGPDWYKEGMADFLCLLPRDNKSVRCPGEVISYLRLSDRPTIQEIVTAEPFTATILDALTRASLLFDTDTTASVTPLASAWGGAEDAVLQQAKHAYAQRWAACHFLACNKNYSKQFYQLGQSLLRDNDINFNQVVFRDDDKINFEFQHFVKNVDQGYRVDLCRWNWNKRFTPLTTDNGQSLSVRAAAGYQPTGCYVTRDNVYNFQADGTWQITRDAKQISADGDTHGTGRLTATILRHYQLSDEIDLGQSGKFVAPVSGELYVRCRDRWNKLSDNSGTVRLNISLDH